MKYLLGEGLKNYKIPLPLVKKKGKHHAGENNKTRLCERHFPSAMPKGEGKKRERPSRCCFICSYVENHYVLFLASKFTTQKGISKNSPIRG